MAKNDPPGFVRSDEARDRAVERREERREERRAERAMAFSDRSESSGSGGEPYDPRSDPADDIVESRFENPKARNSMRNRWGVELKKGYYAFGVNSRGHRTEGRIVSFDMTSPTARAYGAAVKLDTGETVGVDDVLQVLPPMKVGRGGVVKANPLTRIKRRDIATQPSQLTGQPPSERLIKRRRKTAASKVPGIYANPLVRVTVAADSQRPRKTKNAKGRATTTLAPSRRLMARRRATQAAPKGFYANPINADDLRDSTSYGVKAAKAAIYKRVETLAGLIKAPGGRSVGALGLDVANGGYRLVQFTSASGAEKDLSGRLKAAEMLTFLDGAILTARACK